MKILFYNYLHHIEQKKPIDQVQVYPYHENLLLDHHPLLYKKIYKLINLKIKKLEIQFHSIDVFYNFLIQHLVLIISIILITQIRALLYFY